MRFILLFLKIYITMYEIYIKNLYNSTATKNKCYRDIVILFFAFHSCSFSRS